MHDWIKQASKEIKNISRLKNAYDLNIELFLCIFSFNHAFSKLLTYEFDFSLVY